MNREEAKQLWPLVKAFGDGEEIQEAGVGGWFDLGETVYFNVPPKILRVKPQPKLRPYTDEELRELVGKIVVNKNTKSRFVVTCCEFGRAHIGGVSVDVEFLLNRFEHLDASPCGVAE